MAYPKIEPDITTIEPGRHLVKLFGETLECSDFDLEQAAGDFANALIRGNTKSRSWIELDGGGQVTLWGDERSRPELNCWLIPKEDGTQIGFMRFNGPAAGQLEKGISYDITSYTLPLSRVMEVLEANIDVQAESLEES